MSERITLRDLDRALVAHIAALAHAGITYDGDLVVEHGSPTAGRAFRLYRQPTGSSGLWPPPIGSDYLGMTKRDAYDELELMSRTAIVYDIAYQISLTTKEETT
jgi:hypothetical protein